MAPAQRLGRSLRPCVLACLHQVFVPLQHARRASMRWCVAQGNRPSCAYSVRRHRLCRTFLNHVEAPDASPGAQQPLTINRSATSRTRSH